MSDCAAPQVGSLRKVSYIAALVKAMLVCKFALADFRAGVRKTEEGRQCQVGETHNEEKHISTCLM